MKAKSAKSRKSSKAGMPPGSIVFIGEKKSDEVKISVVQYSEEAIIQKDNIRLEDLFPLAKLPSCNWIEIRGLHDTRVLENIGENLNIHPLILEDIANTEHHPKIQIFDDYIFTELKILNYEEEGEVTSEQASFLLGGNYVVSLLERESGVFQFVKQRLLSKTGKMFRLFSDYLNYALIDSIVDHYYVIMEKLSDEIESLEERLIDNKGDDALHTIHRLKRNLLFMRKAVWPLREVVRKIEIAQSNLIHDTTNLYLKDLYDHVVQIIDTVDTQREILSEIFDIYLSSMSNKLNQIMKVLTIISTIFIPLTFLAGVYGMNFQFMPELRWVWGYPLLLIFMLAVALGMVYYFKRKKWF